MTRQMPPEEPGMPSLRKELDALWREMEALRERDGGDDSREGVALPTKIGHAPDAGSATAYAREDHVHSSDVYLSVNQHVWPVAVMNYDGSTWEWVSQPNPGNGNLWSWIIGGNPNTGNRPMTLANTPTVPLLIPPDLDGYRLTGASVSVIPPLLHVQRHKALYGSGPGYQDLPPLDTASERVVTLFMDGPETGYGTAGDDGIPVQAGRFALDPALNWPVTSDSLGERSRPEIDVVAGGQVIGLYLGVMNRWSVNMPGTVAVTLHLSPPARAEENGLDDDVDDPGSV